ncbi:flavin monoamine oxidase family protein [Methylibium sp.]|uniref:flavin monoamine oxidase family protein n=1 Tax=Methylibium sp. TaxID=2067992 RepID=UPI003D0C754B
MLDVAIIGGGLCGLALAHSLQARGRDWRLFEARERLGGRALTVRASDGTPIDLGATWFWPGTQPAITRLVADLGLSSFEQHDDGRVLHLSDPNRVPQTVALTEQLVPADDPSAPASAGAVHGGARRVAGGIGAVIEALARPLPAARLRLGHGLEAVVDHGDFVELRLRFGEASYSVNARRVVLALPPRVAAASVRFTPALAPELHAALQATPTWMATAAKAGFAYARPFWREAGHTGNAWVSHAQAMLAEVFDACGPQAGPARYPGAALAGFAALGSAQRESFSRGRELLLESQVVMLFGPDAADPALKPERFWQDWATEPHTCSPADLAEESLQAGSHPHYGEPLLAEAYWQGRLHFGGSETARQGGGYLEGALAAAGRLRGQLLAASAAGLRPQEAANEAPDRLQQAAADNERQLDRFGAWVRAERGHAMARYRERMHQALSRQDDARLTQRAVLGALESLYAAALEQLERLPLASAHLPGEPGRAALTSRVLEPLTDCADELLAEVVIFNNTSCALSNFPFEHRPSGDYLRSIRRELAAAWQVFAAAANERLLAKAGAVAAA